MANNFNFEIATKEAINSATSTFELYKLRQSYAAYINLLQKSKQRHDMGEEHVLFDSRNLSEDCFENEYKEEKDIVEVCFGDQIDGLFSLIKSEECFTCRPINGILTTENIFLLPDKDKLLIIETCSDWESKLHEYFIESQLLEIGRHCKGKTFTKEHGKWSSFDGWDSDDIPAFAFFRDDIPFANQITSAYHLTDELKRYDGVDIRDILTPMSFEEIAYRLKTAKKEKEKQITLTYKNYRK